MRYKKPEKPIIIAVDGPAASGKGTLSHNLADHFDYARLDTGLIYRALGLKIIDNGGDPGDKNIAILIAKNFTLNDMKKENLRSEIAAAAASKIAVIPEVRQILLQLQRTFAAAPPEGKPGAVLDGRDIGSVVCPHADFKFFLLADTEIRASRRFKELQERGSKAIHSRILRDMKDRDARDMLRSIAPLKPVENAFILDTSYLSADDVFFAALKYISAQNHN